MMSFPVNRLIFKGDVRMNKKQSAIVSDDKLKEILKNINKSPGNEKMKASIEQKLKNAGKPISK